MSRRNKKTQYGESGKRANEEGGTVNPALLTITTKEETK